MPLRENGAARERERALPADAPSRRAIAYVQRARLGACVHVLALALPVIPVADEQTGKWKEGHRTRKMDVVGACLMTRWAE